MIKATMVGQQDKEVVVIYHADCFDGFGAALAARQYLGTDGVEYYPGIYKEPPPNIKNKIVFLVDFSYPAETVKTMLDECAGLIILDHHKTAIEDFAVFEPSWQITDLTKYQGKIDIDRYLENVAIDYCENAPARLYTYFDNNRSGAMIAWEFFNKTPPPPLIQHIQDRDLWRFNIPYTHEVLAAVSSYHYDFEIWQGLLEMPIEDLITIGTPVYRKQVKDVNDAVRMSKRRIIIGGHDVPVVSVAYSMASDTASLMAEDEVFAAAYYDTEKYRVFNLRSRKGGIDVSAIAKYYGGGGHYHAAGFKVSRNHLLAVS